MDISRTLLLREVLAESGLVEQTREFGQALRLCTRSVGGLLLLGPPDDEPWHLTAHLDDEARLNHIPELAPTLVRWDPPPDGPRHLNVGTQRLKQTRRGESLLVVAESETPDTLLERVDDVRRKGGHIFTVDTGQKELTSLAHEVLTVDAAAEPLVSFEAAQHLVSVAASEFVTAPRRRFDVRSGLGRLLDVIAGPEH